MPKPRGTAHTAQHDAASGNSWRYNMNGTPPTRLPRSRLRIGALLAVAASLALVTPAPAQYRAPGDRSLSTSLLAASASGPSAPAWTLADSAGSRTTARYELGYGRPFAGSTAGGSGESVILGVRSETQQRASEDCRHSLGFAALRMGIRVGDRDGKQPISAFEVSFGGRSLGFLDRRGVPDVGIEVVAGWGNLGVDPRASFGFRFPVEMVRQSRAARVTLFAVPSLAWGHMRLRPCDDYGPNDGCGDLGVQAAFGQTRFLLGGGGSLTMLPARVSLVAGVQRLFANGERTRAWVGTTWTP